MTDQQYIEAIRNRNEQLFAECYDQNKGLFVGYFAKHYDKEQSYVVDLYQDACVILWQKATDEHFALRCTLSTYMIGVGKMLMMSRDRKYKSMISYDDRLMHDWSDDLDVEANLIERDHAIEQIVAQMTEPCNTLLNKVYWDDLPGEQIAQEMGYKNTDTVKTQKYKCMQKLKVVLQKKISSI